LEEEEKNNLFISEDWINKSDNYRLGSTEVYETPYDNVGELYKYLVREYGRCVSKIYIDNEDSSKPPKKIGWVFEKRSKYEDTGESFIQETWVTVHNSLPKKTIEYDYHSIK
jgi:hypothetical protein